MATVCVCTYKRPAGLRALLDGVGKQTFDGFRQLKGQAPQLALVVVDNEGSAEVRSICEGFSLREWPLAYVHEPQRGISFARNACLDHLPPGCDVFAFIDDDEVPEPDWLDQLLLAQAATGADAVQGRVEPAFRPDAPAWITTRGFFCKPERATRAGAGEVRDLQGMNRAATDNVLLRTATIRDLGLRFDPAFALSGGSDTLFFRTLHARGGRIVYAHRAVVYEHIPKRRATFRYMFVERFRIAHVNTLIEEKMKGIAERRSRLLAVGLGKMGSGMRRATKTTLRGAWHIDRFAKSAFLIAEGLGVIAAAAGWRYQHYR